MRVAADIPVQKLLGIGSETLGTLSLIYALVIFSSHCVHPLQSSYKAQGLDASFWSGPGIYCYALCAVSGGIRAIVHWLTPLPGRVCSCLRVGASACIDLSEQGSNEPFGTASSSGKSCEHAMN